MINMKPAPTDVVLLGAFQALADENRLRIVGVLQEGERCVCDLQSSLDLGQSLLSHHLRVLREAGLVRSRREGRWVYYALSGDALEQVERWARSARSTAKSAAPIPGRC